jgi:geranylgeranyl reductase family protein
VERCDVLIVGGGPGGSTCAWRLHQAGVKVAVIDKADFPRDKICAGWITPQVIESLRLDAEEYSSTRTLQPITTFCTSLLGHRRAAVEFDHPISYGIRRREFDDYLLRRSGATLRLGEPVKSIERTSDGWVINGQLAAPMLVGAGGHFCPIARRMRESTAVEPPLVTAVEAEFPIDGLADRVGADGCSPHLLFCPDLGGYGWCVRKGEYLNIGLGRVDSKETSAQLPDLLTTLQREGSFTGEVPQRFHGHAYYLYDGCSLKVVDDGVLLIGDAAGLSYPQSGEGIRPAVESGIMAAQTILAANGRYDAASLRPYQDRIEARFGKQRISRSGSVLSWLPTRWKTVLLSRLISSRWFARKVIIERWFLHAHQPALLP